MAFTWCTPEALTGIALPVKVVLRVTVTTELLARLLARGTVGERNVVVGNVVEEVNLLLLQQQAGGDGVYRRVTPALVEESAVLVERLKEVGVGLGPEPVQVANLKVGPLEKLS